MTKDELAAFRAQIMEMAAYLKETQETASGAADTVTLDQSAMGRVSRIDALQQQQMALEAQRRRTLQRRQIDGALLRIEQGSYGECYICGEPIALARLHLNPLLTRCLACAEAGP